MTTEKLQRQLRSGLAQKYGIRVGMVKIYQKVGALPSDLSKLGDEDIFLLQRLISVLGDFTLLRAQMAPFPKDRRRALFYDEPAEFRDIQAEAKTDWRTFVRLRFDEYYSGETMDTPLKLIKIEIEDELENFRFKNKFPCGLKPGHRAEIEAIRRASAAYHYRQRKIYEV